MWMRWLWSWRWLTRSWLLGANRSITRSSISLGLATFRPPGLEFAHGFCIYLGFSSLGVLSFLLKHRGLHQCLSEQHFFFSPEALS